MNAYRVGFLVVGLTLALVGCDRNKQENTPMAPIVATENAAPAPTGTAGGTTTSSSSNATGSSTAQTATVKTSS